MLVMKTYNHILNTIKSKGAAYLVLLDPDKFSQDRTGVFLQHCEKSGVDGFLVGGSLMISGNFELLIEKVKTNTNLPAIISPEVLIRSQQPLMLFCFYLLLAAEMLIILLAGTLLLRQWYKGQASNRFQPDIY